MDGHFTKIDPVLLKSGAIVLIERKRSTQLLSLILSTLLVWPTSVPWAGVEMSSDGRQPAQSGDLKVVGGIHGRDRKACLDDPTWSDLGDNVEESDSRDEFPSSPLAFDFFSMDFPNLVASSLDVRSLRSFDRLAFFVLSPPLRC